LYASLEMTSVAEKAKRLFRLFEAAKQENTPLTHEDVRNIVEDMGFSFHVPSTCDIDTAFIPFRAFGTFMYILSMALRGETPSSPECKTITVFRGAKSSIPTFREIEAMEMQEGKELMGRTDFHYYHGNDVETPIISVYSGQNHPVLRNTTYDPRLVNAGVFYSTPLSEATTGEFASTIRWQYDPLRQDLITEGDPRLSSLQDAVTFAALRMEEEVPTMALRDSARIVWSLQPRISPRHFEGAFYTFHGDGFLRQGLVYLPGVLDATRERPALTIFSLRDTPTEPSSEPSRVPILPVPRRGDVGDYSRLIDLGQYVIPFWSLLTFDDTRVDHSRPLRPLGSPAVTGDHFLFVGIWNRDPEANGLAAWQRDIAALYE
jgi:hypothetical protein